MKIPEILAPAGNMTALKYAVMAGCDAVYIGGKNFGARAFASNFTNEEVIEAINYCHLYGVKVYVTVNTLVHDREINDFIEFIDFLHKNNVDAVIMQDLGMIYLVHKIYPNLEIHASTQMNIHNVDGVLFAEKLGVKRVVLAREVTYEQLKNIKNNTTADLEVFVHGSLCVSYSGQCLLGYYLNNRSGNRGECSGACRLKYDVIDDNNKKLNEFDYPISTKDLNTLEYIGKLIDLNVTSLKIEGRMKSPEYVYMVVSLYREAVDSYVHTGKVYINQEKLNNLKKIYNRLYTKGFLFNEENNNFVNMHRPNHQGVVVGKVISYEKPYVKVLLSDNISIGSGLRIVSKSKDIGVLLNEFYINRVLVKSAKKGDTVTFKVLDNVSKNSTVLITKDSKLNKNIESIVTSKPRMIPININIRAKINDNLYVSINDDDNFVVAFGSLITKAVNRVTTRDEIISKLNKLGNTIYKINNIDFEIDDDIFISMSEINDIRRKLIEELNQKRLYKIPYKKEEFLVPKLKDYELDKIKCALLVDASTKLRYDIVYSIKKENNCILKLPRIMNDYCGIPNKKYLVSEYGALNVFKNVDTDYSLNVFNAYSVAYLHSIGVNKITLSVELSEKDIKELVNNYLCVFK